MWDVIRGGDGTTNTGDDVVSPEVNLWPYFNATCFKDFHDGTLLFQSLAYI